MDDSTQRVAAVPVGRPWPRSASEWASALGPTVLLLPLAWLPWDMATSLFWLAGGIAAVVGAVRVLALLPLALARRPCDLPRLARATATVLLFGAVLAALLISLARADGTARSIAAEAQARCVADSACPSSVPSWGGRGPLRKVGFTSEYEVHYRGGGDQFVVTVLHNIDETLVISGGVRQELAEKLVGDGRPE